VPDSSVACWRGANNGRQQNWRCGRVSGDGRWIGWSRPWRRVKVGLVRDVNHMLHGYHHWLPYACGATLPHPARDAPPTRCICSFPASSSPDTFTCGPSATKPRVVCLVATGPRLHSLPVHCAWRPLRRLGEATGSMLLTPLDIILEPAESNPPVQIPP
jgi:hypothetical protein